MRFHHSTRRGRNRLSQHPNSHRPSSASTSRWSQLGYCRETNIHFHRRLPVEPPARLLSLAKLASSSVESQLAPSRQGSLKASASHRRSLRDKRLQAANQEIGGVQQAAELKLHRLSLSDPSTQRPEQQHSERLDMDSVRQKLVAQVEKHPFWSSRAAKRMQLTEIRERRVLIYELTSFCERRDLEWRYESYRGGLTTAASTPYRRVDLSSSDLSPATRFGAGGHPPALNNWARSSSATGGTVPSPTPESPLSESSAMRRLRRHSSAGNPALATPTSSSSLGAGYEPISAIERPAPSADYVWSIEPADLVRPTPFSGRAHSMELPGSSFVKRCHGCQGRGRLKCTSCYGVGYEVCLSCSGKGSIKSLASAALASSRSGRSSYASAEANPRNSPYANGYDQSESSESASFGRRANEPGGITSAHSPASSAWATESCHYCHGAGQKRCWVCAGKSYNHCLGCLGAGQLRCYLQLNITWLNHRDENVLNNSDNIIPRDRLRLSSGKPLLDELEDSLTPLSRSLTDGATSQRVPEANQLQQVSRRLLEKHQETFRLEERILKQRQRVTQVDCHVVSYEWKQQRGHFVIYGDERKVYIAKYPFKSFCNIT